MLLVMTDGISKDRVVGPAMQLKRKGVEIFSLGIGKGYKKIQLQRMASGPRHVFTSGFSILGTLVKTVKQKVCAPVVTTRRKLKKSSRK